MRCRRPFLDRWPSLVPPLTVAPPLTVPLGAQGLTDIFAEVFKPLYEPKTMRYKTAVDNLKLVAEGKTFVETDFEHFWFTSLRVQLTGKTTFMLFDFKSFGQVAPLVFGMNPASTTLLQLRARLKDVTPEEAKAFSEHGVHPVSCELGPEESLFIPGGWLVTHTASETDRTDSMFVKKLCHFSGIFSI